MTNHQRFTASPDRTTDGGRQEEEAPLKTFRTSTLTVFSVVALTFLTAAGITMSDKSGLPERLLPSLATDAPAAAAAAPSGDAAPLYQQAALSYRQGDLDAMRSHLARLMNDASGEGARARVVLGLYEFVGGGMPQAVDTLVAAEGDPLLEDWRLYALAESAAVLGRNDLATTSLTELVEAHPSSPLRGRALLTAAGLAWENENAARALALVDRAHQEKVSGSVRTRLDVLAWRIGRETEDRAVEREAARRLLIDSPPEARRLKVADIFRDAEGRIDDWNGVLTPDEVKQRARSWLDAGQGLSAQNTLETLRGDGRDFEWEILMAQALTEQGRGDRAYSRLRAVSISSAEQMATLEWQRAMAAADVATARSGRKNLPAAQRERMLALAQQHLRRVIELDAAADISVNAIRKLYGYLAEEGRYDESMEMLALLRQIDPQDRTGASYLWERGWDEYQKRNFTGAIGHWTQLEQLYPDDRETHRGRYWKARAFDELGESRRARATLRQIVETADTADFYVRRALDRLGGGELQAAADGFSSAWPGDEPLRRVLALSNYGLDPLAEMELEILEESGMELDRRDLMAMRGILEVRQGNPRQGVQTLRAAFPSLGGAYQAALPRPVLEAYYPLEFREAIWKEAQRRDLPPSLVAGIIRQESAFDNRATSHAGARGLMQLMPATAREVSGKLGERYVPERLYDPQFSVMLGTTYFKQVLDTFDGNVELALAGYNGGPYRMKRLWREAGPDAQLDIWLENLGISESRNYVKRILVLADSYRQLYAADEEPAAGPVATRSSAG